VCYTINLTPFGSGPIEPLFPGRKAARGLALTTHPAPKSKSRASAPLGLHGPVPGRTLLFFKAIRTIIKVSNYVRTSVWRMFTRTIIAILCKFGGYRGRFRWGNAAGTRSWIQRLRMHGAVSPLPHLPHDMDRDNTFLPSLSGSCFAFGEGKHSTVLLSFLQRGEWRPFCLWEFRLWVLQTK